MGLDIRKIGQPLDFGDKPPKIIRLGIDHKEAVAQLRKLCDDIEAGRGQFNAINQLVVNTHEGWQECALYIEFEEYETKKEARQAPERITRLSE